MSCFKLLPEIKQKRSVIQSSASNFTPVSKFILMCAVVLSLMESSSDWARAQEELCRPELGPWPSLRSELSCAALGNSLKGWVV